MKVSKVIAIALIALSFAGCGKESKASSDKGEGRNKTVLERWLASDEKDKVCSEKGAGEDYSDPKAFFKKYFMEGWFYPRYGSESYKKAMRFKEVRVDNLRLDVSLGMTAVCADVRIIPEPGVVYIDKKIEPWHILTTEDWDTSLSGSKLDGDSYLRAEVTIRRVKLDNGVFVPAEPVRDRGGLNYAVQGFGSLEDLRVYKPSDSEIMAAMLRRTVEEVEKAASKKDEAAARHGLDAYVWTEYSCGNQFRFIHDTTLKRRLYVALKKLIAIAGWDAEKVKHHKISNILRLLSRDVEKDQNSQGTSSREHLLQALRAADFESARKFAMTVLENDPYEPDANFALGMWHYQHKRWKEAETHLLRCTDNKPKEPSVWNNLAMIYLEQGKLDVARQYAHHALSLLPSSEEIKDTINQIATAAERGKARGSVLNAEANGGKTNLYLVIDLSRGMSASSYPISYLDEVPQGGWSTEYKTSKLVLRRISPGTFMMGSPDAEIGHSAREAQHEVTITQPFYMGVFPVTQRQYELVTGKMPSYFFNESYYEARPVERVTWNDIRGESSTYDWPESSDVDASTFIGLLRRKTGIRTLDLPTEAKWEYCCRAGATSALNSGKDLTKKDAMRDANMDKVGRYAGNFPSGNVQYSHGSDLSAGTATVGSYLPNAWGLYDMHGNVFEWCLDWYDEFSTDAVSDPVGPASGTYRICRGGSWFRSAPYCRSASRNWRSPSHEHNFDNGFRVCCDIMSATTTTNAVRPQAKRSIGVRYTPVSTNEATVAETLEELNDLIGLKPVKDELARFAKTMLMDQQRKTAGLKTLPMSHNMVFTGNPGTGKTTVARIMAKLYKALGVLKSGHFVEADRSGLVAGDEAQTVLKTGRAIDLALDGVLFIDTANALSKGPKDRCGNAAIATLLKRMDDDRDRLVVILAGGAEELRQFLNANSALSSRFTHYVEFPDYTAEELATMFRMVTKTNKYVLSPEVEQWLDAFIRVRTAKRDRNFGNGRWARDLFGQAVSRHTARVEKLDEPTPEQMKTLTMADVGIKLKTAAMTSKDLLNLLACCYVQDGLVEKPREAYQTVLAKDASNHEALMGLWRISLQEGALDEAKAYLERAVKVPLKVGTVRFDEVLLHMMNNGLDEARLALAKITGLRPHSVQGWALLASIVLQQADKAQTEEQKQKFLDEVEAEILPKMEASSKAQRDFFVQMTRALVLTRRGNDKETQKKTRAALELAWINRPVVSVGTMVLDLDYRLLDRESAERHALQILRQDAGHAFANYVMGSLLMGKGNMKEAEAYLRTSVAAPHPLASAQNDLAEVLRQDKRLVEAEKYAREAKDTDPKLYVAWETLCATLLDRNKNLYEAEQCIQKAIELSEGKDIRMQLTLARVQLAKKDFVKARDTLLSLDKRQLTDERDRAAFDELTTKAQGK